jgi:hypothetical protein
MSTDVKTCTTLTPLPILVGLLLRQLFVVVVEHNAEVCGFIEGFDGFFCAQRKMIAVMRFVSCLAASDEKEPVVVLILFTLNLKGASAWDCHFWCTASVQLVQCLYKGWCIMRATECCFDEFKIMQEPLVQC